jgi:hypothetical protein
MPGRASVGFPPAPGPAYGLRVASLEDVRRIAMSLPEVTEDVKYDDWAGWRVRTKSFAWERPLGRKDVADLEERGERVPRGEILGLRAKDVAEKELLIASGARGVFTIPHFDRYSGFLVELARIPEDELTELVVDAWLAQAPKRLAASYLASVDDAD